MKRILVSILLPILLCGCTAETDRPPQSGGFPDLLEESSTIQQESSTASLRFAAVGDNLIHDVIYNQAKRNASGNDYDFSYVYSQFAPLLSGYDIALINQETPMFEKHPPQNYPLFNTPKEVAGELKNIGFNAVTHANNHMLDQGEQGLLATIDVWKDLGVTLTGAYESSNALEESTVFEANGIKIAFVGVTEHTNGLSLPYDSQVKILYLDDFEGIKSSIERAKADSDLVLVAAHWGNENTFEPTVLQRQMAKCFADWGADIIIGHHSHTVQPAEYITAQDGRRVLTIYSLGNFVSAMNNACNMLGAMFSAEFRKTPQGTEVVNPQIIPIVTHYEGGMKDVRVIPLNSYDAALALAHGVRRYDQSYSYKYLLDSVEQVYSVKFSGNPIDLLDK